jgi:hypothetical protein
VNIPVQDDILDIPAYARGCVGRKTTPDFLLEIFHRILKPPVAGLEQIENPYSHIPITPVSLEHNAQVAGNQILSRVEITRLYEIHENQLLVIVQRQSMRGTVRIVRGSKRQYFRGIVRMISMFCGSQISFAGFMQGACS